MKNFVPLGTGNSRLMKSSIPAGTTWEQALAMLIAGTFPYDTGQLNAAGISQQGDPLNKNTLLKDATAQKYGLGTDAVPDDVLGKLAQSLKVEQAQVPDKILGRDWTKNGSSLSLAYGLCYGNGVVVKFGSVNSKYIYWSEDEGVTWTAANFPYSSMIFCDLIFFNGRFVLSCYYNVNTYLYYSDDGKNWTRSTYNSNLGRYFSVANGVLYATYYYSSNTTYTSFTADGVNWSNLSANSSLLKSQQRWIGWINGKYVTHTTGSAERSSVVFSSLTDSSYEGTMAVLSHTDNVCRGMINAFGALYAFIGVTVYRTTDAVSWEAMYTASDNWGRNRVVMRGSDSFLMCVFSSGDVVYSDDGVNFDHVSLSGMTSNCLFSVGEKPDGSGIAVLSKSNDLPLYVSVNTFKTAYALLTPNGEIKTDDVASALGLPGVQIATGSYRGTNTYGSSNPNTLTFGFAPKLIILSSGANINPSTNPTYTNNIVDTGWFIHCDYVKAALSAGAAFCYYPARFSSSSKNMAVSFSNDGKTISWYTTEDNVMYQFNESDKVYHYIAIG